VWMVLVAMGRSGLFSRIRATVASWTTMQNDGELDDETDADSSTNPDVLVVSVLERRKRMRRSWVESRRERAEWQTRRRLGGRAGASLPAGLEQQRRRQPSARRIRQVHACASRRLRIASPRSRKACCQAPRDWPPPTPSLPGSPAPRSPRSANRTPGAPPPRSGKPPFGTGQLRLTVAANQPLGARQHLQLTMRWITFSCFGCTAGCRDS
jgi:hypothetical protein